MFKNLVAFCLVVLATTPLFSSATITPGTNTQVTTSDNVANPPVIAGSETSAILIYRTSANNLFSSTSSGSSWSTPSAVATATDDLSPWIAGSGTTYTSLYSSALISSKATTNSGSSWGSATAIVSTDTGPATIAGTSTRFVMGYTSASAVRARVSTDNGATWSTSTLLSGAQTVDSFTNVASAGSSSFLAAWRKNDGTAQTSFSSDGVTWSTPVEISFSGTVDTNVWVSGGSLGYLASWQDSTGKAYASFSSNNGATWSAPTQIASSLLSAGLNSSVSSTATSSSFVTCWVGSDNNVYASASSNGTTWSTPTQITSSGNVDTTAIGGTCTTNVTFATVGATTAGCVFSWLQTDGNAYANFATIAISSSNNSAASSSINFDSAAATETIATTGADINDSSLIVQDSVALEEDLYNPITISPIVGTYIPAIIDTSSMIEISSLYHF